MKIARVRRVISRSTSRTVYKFPSIRLKRVIYCESSIELDYCFLLDSDHGDKPNFKEQPGKIAYCIDGRRHTYTPDFLVERPRKAQIVEVKPRDQIEWEENQLLYSLIGPLCLKAGYEFIVVPDDKIRVQPRLENTKVLWKYGRTHLSPQHHIYCNEFFSRSPEACLAEVFEYFARQKEQKRVVYSLLFWGVIGIDMTRPIDFDSAVYLPS